MFKDICLKFEQKLNRIKTVIKPFLLEKLIDFDILPLPDQQFFPLEFNSKITNLTSKFKDHSKSLRINDYTQKNIPLSILPNYMKHTWKLLTGVIRFNNSRDFYHLK
jgi:hypothetical protein